MYPQKIYSISRLRLDFFRPFHYTFEYKLRGYRIAAIMRPCQGRDTGATPVTRFEEIREVPADRDFYGILGYVQVALCV